jgi:hypothetical protein
MAGFLRLQRLTTLALFLAVELLALFTTTVIVSDRAGAQILDDRFPFLEERARRRRQNQQYQQYQQPYYQDQSRQAPVDYSRAPAPRKSDSTPMLNVVVLGDSMADWLAYGLEDAFSETPEIGVTRKHRTHSGLIRNDTKPENVDWAQLAREVLAGEKPDFVVMMIGLEDRQPIRERQARQQAQPKQPSQPNQGKQAGPQGAQPAPAQQPAARPADANDELTKEPSSDANAPKPNAAPDQQPSASVASHDFRSERWEELYNQRIDEVIAALKSKGAPVFWVGLPPIRGTRSTADMVYLNDLYRARAEKAGIIYVDVWDGFVDENGNYTVHGPDFEGQIRRLRTGDGTYFTIAGARKLAHYVEREIRRVMLARGAPLAAPAPEEPPEPAVAAKPGGPAQRPNAAPAVSITGAPPPQNGLLGGSSPSSASDPLASRALVKGEPMTPPPGRADDFVWPRREVVRAGSAGPEPPSAATADSPASTTSQAPRPARAASSAPRAQPRVAQEPQQPSFRRSFLPPFFWPFFR